MKSFIYTSVLLSFLVVSCSDSTEFAGKSNDEKTGAEDGSGDGSGSGDGKGGSTGGVNTKEVSGGSGKTGGTGDGGGTTPGGGGSTPGGTNPKPVTNCTVTPEQIKAKLPQAIKDCMASGKIYNFYTKACSPVSAASSFKCDFAGVKTKLTNLGIGTAVVDNAVKEKAIMVACGEKRAGLTAVTQWWVPNEETIDPVTCQVKSLSTITTGCFQQNNGDGTITEPTADGKHTTSTIIQECLK